jgi:ankyrin repeat protein
MTTIIKDDTPLHEAVYNEDYNLIERLLKSGANPGILNNGSIRKSPIYIAVEKQNHKIVKLMLKYYTIKNEKFDKGNTLLHIAAYNNDKTMINLLLNNGADDSIKNKDGYTPSEIINFYYK